MIPLEDVDSPDLDITEDSFEQATHKTTHGTVHRRRSTYHHRRRNARHNGSPDNEKRLQRLLNLKVLGFVFPVIILIAGGTLWVYSNLDPDESMRPKGQIKLSYQMLLIGGVFFAIAIVVDWIRRTVSYVKEQCEKVSTKRNKGRRKRRRRNREPQA